MNESEGTVTLFVRVIEGLLNRTAEVSFATGDFTAIGEQYQIRKILYLYLHVYMQLCIVYAPLPVIIL